MGSLCWRREGADRGLQQKTNEKQQQQTTQCTRTIKLNLAPALAMSKCAIFVNDFAIWISLSTVHLVIVVEKEKVTVTCHYIFPEL